MHDHINFGWKRDITYFAKYAKINEDPLKNGLVSYQYNSSVFLLTLKVINAKSKKT